MPERVHVVSIPGETRVSVQFLVPRTWDSGQPEPVGLAHYAEHLAWLNAVGTKARAADRHSNAWTAPFVMGYWLSGPAEGLPELLETVAGIFDPITLPASFAEEERGIILREYEQVIGARINAQAHEALAAFLYPDHPLGQSLIGSPEQIKALEDDAARAYHARTHKPERAHLIVAGDVDPVALLHALSDRDLENAFSGPAAVTKPVLRMADPDETRLRFPDADAAPRIFWRRLVRLEKPVSYEKLAHHAQLLRNILYSGLPGGLAGPLRFDGDIARRFDIAIAAIDESHVELSVTASPDRGVSLSRLHEAFTDALAETADAGIPPDTFTRVRQRMLRALPDPDDARAVSRWQLRHVRSRLAMLREPVPAKTGRAQVKALSPDFADALLRQLTGAGRDAVALIGPEEVFQ